METRAQENSTLAFLIEENTISPKVDMRERIKIEFYKTYDVMTGIRIAATLGGFFSMMILLVLYKNYCKPSKTLSEEQLNAAVTAAAEEEDRALQAALEATSFYTSLEKQRHSFANTNQILLSPRFSSVGGGYSHLTPPLKIAVLQQRGKSLPGSVMQFSSCGNSSSFQKNGKISCLTKEEDFDLDSQPSDYTPCKNHLNVLPCRRISSVTCSSADSSYLERRCSAFEIGLPELPHFVKQSNENLIDKNEGSWDFHYPIDIQVIQPTPELSPTASERSLHEEHFNCSLQVPVYHDQTHRLSVTSFEMGLAPLASISSLGSFSSHSSSLLTKSYSATNNKPTENQGCGSADDSVGSDSVFLNDIDVEDDVDLGTDSEIGYDGFDDDYSFCESNKKSLSRTEMGNLKFASFDSYDTSIAQDSVLDLPEEVNKKLTEQPVEKIEKMTHILFKQNSIDLKRRPSLHEGKKIRKKLMKTNSEPKSSKLFKQLPLLIEKGRSGYVPKRHLSSPSPKKKSVLEISKETCPEGLVEKNFESCTKPSQEENFKDLFLLLPPSPNSSFSGSIAFTPSTQKSDETSTSSPKQGLNKDLPFKTSHQLSLLNAQEKRNRLQKQKNFMEEIKPTNEKTEMQKLTGTEELKNSSNELFKPSVVDLTGSCERLPSSKLCEEMEEKTPINQISEPSCKL